MSDQTRTIETVRAALDAAIARLAVAQKEYAAMLAAKDGIRRLTVTGGKWELGAVARLMETPEPNRSRVTVAFFEEDNLGRWPLERTVAGARYNMVKEHLTPTDNKPL